MCASDWQPEVIFLLRSQARRKDRSLKRYSVTGETEVTSAVKLGRAQRVRILQNHLLLNREDCVRIAGAAIEQRLGFLRTNGMRRIGKTA